MSEALRSKQWVPVSATERKALQAEAEARGVTVGLLARALLLHAFDRIETDEVGDRIEQERVETRQRISKGASAAAKTRWGHWKGSEL